MTDQHPQVMRVVRWVRTITIEGPEDWVESTRQASLADGIQLITTKHGFPCTIHADTTDATGALRGVVGRSTNAEMLHLRVTDPTAYEQIHGPGTAKEHAANDPTPAPTTEPTPGFGTYL